jgi:DNA-binding transcriptional LysR family regulator
MELRPLRPLRYAIGISEAGSLLVASRALHVVQPALSHQVALVERELDTPLFVRSHRGMSLTPAGRAFVEHARVVLQDVERLRSSVREDDGQIGGTLVLGLPTAVDPWRGAGAPRRRTAQADREPQRLPGTGGHEIAGHALEADVEDLQFRRELRVGMRCSGNWSALRISGEYDNSIRRWPPRLSASDQSSAHEAGTSKQGRSSAVAQRPP